MLRPATSADWPAIATLLAGHALPLDGAIDHLATFRVAIDGSDLVGVAVIEAYGDVRLLRSVAVGNACRRPGRGSRLADDAIDGARAWGVRSLYLLTTTAAPFFGRRGFAIVARETAPPALHASAEFSGACPAIATLMRRTIG